MDIKFTTDMILKEAITSFKENSKYFLILGFIYTGLTFAIDYFVNPAKFIGHSSGLEIFMVFLIMYILLALINAKLAIMVHRSVLLQESNLNKMFSWTTKELKFALVLFGVTLLFFITIFVISFIVGAITAIVGKNNYIAIMIVPIILILGLIIGSRISLIFPAIAIRRSLKLADSWNQTKGYTFSLFVLLILVPFLTSLLQNKLASDSMVLTAVLSLISVFVVIFQVTVLSHCFVAFFGENKNTENDTLTEIV
jgi:hypothetical protein